MAHFVFVSLYDEHCHGLRLLVAGLKAAGHRAELICFKQYTQIPLEEAHEVWDECHIQVLPCGDFVNSYSYPATQAELDLFVDLVGRLDPDLVGFGMTATQQRPAATLARLVKERLGKTVFFGGPHPTTSPEWSVREGGADFVCRGEADEAILRVAETIDRGGDLRDAPNMCYLGEDGRLVLNECVPLIEDLDPLPFPDHSDDNYYLDHDTVLQGKPFPESELGRTYLVMTARGCPFHCTFCYNNYMQDLYCKQPKVRFRSIPRVIEELKHAKEQRGGHFYLEILDSVFTLRPSRVREFCEAYHREINLPFWCYTHPKCAREETIAPMGECPNCEYVIMGIQSASDEIGQKTFHRVQTREDILEAANTIHRHGIKVFYDIITNNPGETESMCRENLDLLRELPKPWRLRLSKISLFPEYEIRDVTGQTRAVTSRRYRLWNALYFLVQDVDLSDEEIDEILADPVLEARPQILERINGAFEDRFRALDDARSRLKVEKGMHGLTRDALREAQDTLADIRYRKGFRHFMKVTDLIESRLGARRPAAADEACPPAAAPGAPAEGEYHRSVLSMANPSDKRDTDT